MPFIDESPTMSPQLCVRPDGDAVSPTPPESLLTGVSVFDDDDDDDVDNFRSAPVYIFSSTVFLTCCVGKGLNFIQGWAI